MSAQTVALSHYRSRRRLADALAAEARRLWQQVDRARISASWDELTGRLLIVTMGAQRAAASAADGYLEAVLAEQGISAAAEGRVAAGALADVASDGRPLLSLLRQPAITTLVGLDQGATQVRALAAGQATLDMIVRTQVADAGRVADQLALTARPAAQGYVRMVVGKTCSRCLILAGKFYRWNTGFQRHPRCDCTHIPSQENLAGDLRTNPRAAFDALSREDQDRTFGKAGAQAIRDGGDMSRVVNARRGMYVAGGRKLTSEATTRRGINRPVRLMPEQIFRDASSRDDAIRLLKAHGYIL